MSVSTGEGPVEGVLQQQVVAVVPAKDEEQRIGATLAALRTLPAVGAIVVDLSLIHI